ncbi:hypothetical protein V8J88_08355 [Massilia sp. W12]|uniref:hypothetical protein n=1 Tax=Massilia sp. W12 TaxID=3126507 RepID=UPI0030D4576E
MNIRIFTISALTLSLSACSSLTVVQRNSAIGAGVGTVGTFVPGSKMEQTYYLGVFDPLEQLPPTIYRVRVKGQSSFWNLTRYASGWVAAEVIDSLTSNISFNSKNGNINLEKNEPLSRNALNGRGLVLFGPEGFREAPRNHRLVITMGASPEKFFNIANEAMGLVAAAKQGQGSIELERNMFKEIQLLQAEQDILDNIYFPSDKE